MIDAPNLGAVIIRYTILHATLLATLPVGVPFSWAVNSHESISDLRSIRSFRNKAIKLIEKSVIVTPKSFTCCGELRMKGAFERKNRSRVNVNSYLIVRFSVLG